MKAVRAPRRDSGMSAATAGGRTGGFDDERYNDEAFSLYLVSLSAVITATVGVLFGIGFLLLASPDPAAPPAEAVSAPLALEAQAVPPPTRSSRTRRRLRGGTAPLRPARFGERTNRCARGFRELSLLERLAAGLVISRMQLELDDQETRALVVSTLRAARPGVLQRRCDDASGRQVSLNRVFSQELDDDVPDLSRRGTGRNAPSPDPKRAGARHAGAGKRFLLAGVGDTLDVAEANPTSIKVRRKAVRI